MSVEINIIESIAELRHIKVVTTEVYTDGLKSIKKQYSLNIPTNASNIMYDLLDCLDVIKNGIADEVTITVKAKHNQPQLICKSWTGERVSY